MPVQFLRICLAIACAGVVAACQSTGGMTALAPASSSAARAPLMVDAIRGPAQEIGQKFEAILLDEAKKRGFAIAGSGQSGAVLRLKAYLDAYAAEGGKTGFAWVIETSEDGQNRTIRVRGSAEIAGASATPWASFDDRAMRQVATLALDDMIRQSSAGTEIAAAPVEE